MAIAELAVKLERAQEDLSQLQITRETVAQVLAELSASQTEPGTASASTGGERIVGAS